MVNINFNYENYTFESVKESDFKELIEWMRKNNETDDITYSLDSQVFYQRFIEYYVTDNECFIIIKKENNIVGVFKGRLDLEDKEELFIWYFTIDRKFRGKGVGSEIIERIIEYFESRYSISVTKVGIVENNIGALNFWTRIRFTFLRSTKNFFCYEAEENKGLVILKR